MGLIDHVEALRAKHADLENLIAEETRRPHPNDEELSRLKRQKLLLKDQMAGLQARSAN